MWPQKKNTNKNLCTWNLSRNHITAEPTWTITVVRHWLDSGNGTVLCNRRSLTAWIQNCGSTLCESGLVSDRGTLQDWFSNLSTLI